MTQMQIEPLTNLTLLDENYYDVKRCEQMKQLKSGHIGQKKIIVLIMLFVLVVCGLGWWFFPVHFLSGIKPEDVVTIQVLNGNNGDEFEIANPDDISHVVNAIKQITFKKDLFASEIPFWYQLTFIDGNGEEIESLTIQNSRFLQKDTTLNQALFYRCNEELSVPLDYLESLEAIWFPDYKKDPDFP